jgi:septal ring factor EnvC (AmiA/AmiB activator)
MNRAFYSLPDPREVGLKWKLYEKARANVERIETRLRKTQKERARLEEEIRDLGKNEVRELAQAILEGTDDPLAKHDEHTKLVERLRTLKREEAAVSQALPQAEESLRLTIYENRPAGKWKPTRPSRRPSQQSVKPTTGRSSSYRSHGVSASMPSN